MKQHSSFIDDHTTNELKELLGSSFDLALSTYITETEEYITKMQEAVNINDIATVTFTSHTIRSSSRQVGALPLSQQAESIEVLCNKISKDEAEGDAAEELTEMVTALTKIFSSTKAALQPYLA